MNKTEILSNDELAKLQSNWIELLDLIIDLIKIFYCAISHSSRFYDILPGTKYLKVGDFMR